MCGVCIDLRTVKLAVDGLSPCHSPEPCLQLDRHNEILLPFYARSDMKKGCLLWIVALNPKGNSFDRTKSKIMRNVEKPTEKNRGNQLLDISVE